MTDTEGSYEGWIGRNAVDQDGNKIGKIEEIYLDDQSGQPEWLAIKTGLFGSNLTFAPLSGSSADGEDLRLPFTKDQVKDAPNVAADGHLEPAEEEQLYRHYDRSDDYDTSNVADTDRSTGRDASGPETDSAMTRSEEELAVGTRSKEAGRVRLRKYVVTENVTTTVPVKREEVRIEREPITDENRDAATSGADISEEEHEMVLHEEEVVAEKRVVAKERVRLDKDVVTDQEQVSEEVRKERIEIDGDEDRDPSTTQ